MLKILNRLQTYMKLVLHLITCPIPKSHTPRVNHQCKRGPALKEMGGRERKENQKKSITIVNRKPDLKKTLIYRPYFLRKSLESLHFILRSHGVLITNNAGYPLRTYLFTCLINSWDWSRSPDGRVACIAGLVPIPLRIIRGVEKVDRSWLGKEPGNRGSRLLRTFISQTKAKPAFK